jgi:hypothetical protein
MKEPPQSPMLTQSDLCKRWNVTRWTLRKMRREGSGPPYFEIETNEKSPIIRYPMSGIEAYELAMTKSHEQPSA